MGTAGQPSTCFRLRRQNPNVFPPDPPPWLIPFKFSKDLQGGGYHLLHSQARGGDTSFDIMTSQYKKGIVKANISVFLILMSPLEQVV